MLASSTSSILFCISVGFLTCTKSKMCDTKHISLCHCLLLATIPYSLVSMNSSVTQAVVRITGSWTTQIFPECGSVCQYASSIHVLHLNCFQVSRCWNSGKWSNYFNHFVNIPRCQTFSNGLSTALGLQCCYLMKTDFNLKYVKQQLKGIKTNYSKYNKLIN